MSDGQWLRDMVEGLVRGDSLAEACAALDLERLIKAWCEAVATSTLDIRPDIIKVPRVTGSFMHLVAWCTGRTEGLTWDTVPGWRFRRVAAIPGAVPQSVVYTDLEVTCEAQPLEQLVWVEAPRLLAAMAERIAPAWGMAYRNAYACAM